jgi:hypothetical protein
LEKGQNFEGLWSRMAVAASAQRVEEGCLVDCVRKRLKEREGVGGVLPRLNLGSEDYGECVWVEGLDAWVDVVVDSVEHFLGDYGRLVAISIPWAGWNVQGHT